MTFKHILPVIVALLALASLTNTSFAQSDDPLDVGFMVRGAGTQYSVGGQGQLGGLVGFDTTVHLTGNWGLLGSANVNHVEGGDQIAGTLGLVKLSDQCGIGLDVCSFSLLFDQFTDTRVDTFEDSLYLSQLRLQAGYPITQDLEIGTVLSTPTNKEDDVQFFLTEFPSSLPLPGVLKMSNSAKVYLAGRDGSVQWSTNVGYRDGPGTWIFGGTVRAKLTERVAAFAGAIYEENPANFSSFVGMEINISPNRRRRRSCGDCCSIPVVRGQSPVSAAKVRLVSMTVDEPDAGAKKDKGEPSKVNPLDPQRIPLFNGGNPNGDETETIETPDTVAPSLDPTNVTSSNDQSERIENQNQLGNQTRDRNLQNRDLPAGRRFSETQFDSLSRQQTTINSHDFYMQLSIEGLPPSQQEIQGPNTGYNLQKNGQIFHNGLNPVRK